jgi:hypothetical protein
MTLERYLLIVYMISVVGFIALSAAIQEPGIVATDSAWRMLFAVPVAAGALTLMIRRVAVEVPECDRLSFWSYRIPNFILGFVFGVSLLCFSE